MALGYVTATDIVNAALTFYVRGKVMWQTMQERPFLGWLMENQQEFPGGKDNVNMPVQINAMSDTAGFLQGISQDDALNFAQGMNILRCYYPWKQVHAGLIITWTELLQDGISVNDDAKTSEHSQRELTVLTGILENRLDDYAESWARTNNQMLYGDGSQDAKQVPGLTSIITATPNSGTTGGLDKATYPAWRNREVLNIAPSGTTQLLSKTLRSEVRQLRRYGGRPSKILSGSKFIEALEIEVTEKGVYTMEGFTQGAKTDIGVANIRMKGVGEFEYDPTLDDMGKSTECFFLDPRKVKWRPIEGEGNKILKPTRPYNYLVFLRSMTNCGALVSNQLNAVGHYSVPTII